MRPKYSVPLIAALLALPAAYAGPQDVINTVLTTLRDIFTAIFNPSADGLSVFIKFLIIVTVFAVTYDILRSKGGFQKRGVTALIAGSLALIAGLAMPAKLALTTGSILASVVIATILLIPFIILSWVSWKAHSEIDTNWKYPGLALMWLVYFTILVYFLAHWGTLPQVYGWVFTVVLVLATLSPIIVIILLAIVVIGGEEEEGPGFTDLLQKLDKKAVQRRATELNKNLGVARSLLNGITKTKSVESSHQKIRTALKHLKDASDEARSLAAQAAKLEARGIPQTPDHQNKIALARNLLGELQGIMSDLREALDEENPTALADKVKNAGGKNLAKEISNLMDLASVVAQVTPKGAK